MRNYATLEFAPERGLNVFVGANAQGKSNLLEAIGLLGTGKSFRTLAGSGDRAQRHAERIDRRRRPHAPRETCG